MGSQNRESFEQLVSFYSTEDLTQTRLFWTRVVGLEEVLDQGSCAIFRVSSNGFIGFCERESAQVTNDIITLVTPNVDNHCRRLAQQGLTFEKAPAFNPVYNIYHAFFRDPNGYLVEIQRFEDPKWPRATNDLSSGE